MRETFALQGRATNRRQISISLPNDQNGVITYLGNAEHWNIRAATLRGGWRHAEAKQILNRRRKLDPNFKLTTDSARLAALGGVKSSGTSRLMTPVQIAQAKAMNPLIEMFGCNDPAFFAGHTYVSHMTSEDPIDRSRSNNRSYNLQVVRRPLSHGPFTVADLSDPEKIAENAEVNRYRSQLDGLSKQATNLEARLARKADTKVQSQLTNVFNELTKLTTRTFQNSQEVRDFLEAELASMRARGQSTVSEQTIPVGQEVIPAGISMIHSVHMIGASRIGCGLLIDGISQKMFLDPFVGGRSAAGCGGWITTDYEVKRIVTDQYGVDQWMDDCTIRFVPEQYVQFHDAENSQLKACYEEWQTCDIRQFDFSYEALHRIANGNGNNGPSIDE